jgi:hypothetical protein
MTGTERKLQQALDSTTGFRQRQQILIRLWRIEQSRETGLKSADSAPSDSHVTPLHVSGSNARQGPPVV